MTRPDSPRVAIYARYSSDNQREASIDDQLEICRRRATQEGWTIVQIYTDHAISGGSAHGRPSYQSMLSDAERHAFDVILCESLDRLSRRLADVADLHDRLSFLGIKLHAVNVGEVTPIHTAIMGMMAQHYVKDLGEKTKRGQLGRALKGKVPGGKAYGYDVLPAQEDGAGDRAVNLAEASVVHRIFERYAAGDSPRRIARDLNADNIQGPGTRSWSDTTIRGQPERGTGILNNSLYVGRIEWNRCSYVKNPQTGKRVARPNPRQLWEIVDVPHLRIIDDALWERTRTRRQSLSHAMGRDSSGNALNVAHRRIFLLSGLLKCGKCGGGYTITAQDRYGCATRRAKGTCSNHTTILRREIEERVLSALKNRLLTPELTKTFIAAFHDEVRRLKAERSTRSTVATQRLKETRGKIARILTAIEDGFYDSNMNERIAELRATEVELERDLANTPDTNVAPHPNLAELYARKIDELTATLNDPTLRGEASEAIRGLIHKIVLTPRVDDSGLDAEVYGDLAQILALSDAGTQIHEHPAAVAAGCQLSVVAGVGFEPTTFRL